MKKAITIVTLMLCFTLIIVGCNKSPETSGSKNLNESNDTGDVIEEEVVQGAGDILEEEVVTVDTPSNETSTTVNSGDIASITDLSEYWNSLYKTNEAVINAYEGMPIMELVTPGLCFVTGIQYDLLNLYNEDGRFEGELMLAGYPGYVEKKGSKLTFGYEDIRDEDGFSPSMKAGDKDVESGSCDLDKGYYYADSYTEREGVQISRTTSEFKKQADGSMCTIVMEGRTIDFRNNEELSTSYIFIRSGEGQYDFVIASSAIGTTYDFLSLEEDMTKEMAFALFEGAGATIENSGHIKDGKLILD